MFQKLFQRPTGPAVAQLSVAELERRLAAHESLQLIDVRSAEEYQHDGHISGARLIPLPALAQRLHEIDRTRPVVIICRSGNRSQVASELLLRHGYLDISNVQGGMIAWR
ncbi:MAG TPA: rhodanese-like domain-containing protein, partial [Roseiflexaceae bacterium]|nr:rhodanese-like domain-containing protein [Roseiflexaceae bacterium]